MQRFRNILMVYNDAATHQPALAHVITLARQSGAQLTFIDVLEDLRLAPSVSHTALPDDFLALRREDIATNLEALGADLDRVGIKVELGSPPMVIIQEVIRGGHDLVVKTARGPDTGLGGRLFGNTAIKLMRKCPVPVWAFKPAAEIRFPRVLAAVGPPSEDGSDNRLNNDIVSLAAAFARAATGHLDILHCWRLHGESLLTSGRTRISGKALDAMRSQAEDRARDHLNASLLVPDLTGVAHQAHLLQGQVSIALPAFIATEEIDLVVMGSLTQAGIRGMISGSTAEQIFYAANCAVMVVKPPNFVSPILP
ncbi:MAG: universal stress protein [Desulfobacterales bacterium]|nr:universal stress protein [Desulfobacterales bacterium]MDJ0883756.1 universal stress protein [Desulfobacterales bacterium]